MASESIANLMGYWLKPIRAWGIIVKNNSFNCTTVKCLSAEPWCFIVGENTEKDTDSVCWRRKTWSGINIDINTVFIIILRNTWLIVL